MRARNVAVVGLIFAATSASADPLQLVVKVHVPESVGKLTRQEIQRFHPLVQFITHDGKSISRMSVEPLVIFQDYAPKDVQDKGGIAMHIREKRIIYVFTKDLADYVRLNMGDPLYKVALGRVIAHELEHVRRPTGDHDETGWFRSHLSKDQMIQIGWAGR